MRNLSRIAFVLMLGYIGIFFIVVVTDVFKPKAEQLPLMPAKIDSSFTAEIKLESGSGTIVVFPTDSPTIVRSDGVEHVIWSHKLKLIDVSHEASVNSGGGLIRVNFNGKGSYREIGGKAGVVTFDGNGAITQEIQDLVRLWLEANFAATQWGAVHALDQTTVNTSGVDYVFASDHANVTVNNCWSAAAHQSSRMQTTNCRNVIAREAADVTVLPGAYKSLVSGTVKYAH